MCSLSVECLIICPALHRHVLDTRAVSQARACLLQLLLQVPAEEVGVVTQPLQALERNHIISWIYGAGITNIGNVFGSLIAALPPLYLMQRTDYEPRHVRR